MQQGTGRPLCERVLTFRETVALFLAVALVISVCGCARNPPPEPSTIYKTVEVRVPSPCVTDRPPEVQPLNRRVPPANWAALAPGAKAQSVKAQAGERMNYEDKLRVATNACPEIMP